MYRCEDAPCCGCGPEGCVDTSRTVECSGCGKSFHPDQNTEETCYRCQVSVRDIYAMEGDYDDYYYEEHG